MKLRKGKTKKVISLFDIHYPFNINLDSVLKFIKDEQPDEIILGGDQIDMHGVSKHYNGDVEDGVYETHKEIIGFKDILDQIKKAAPKAKIIWLDGNHCDRVWGLIEASPDRAQLIDHTKILSKYIDKYIKYNSFYKVGKLYYTHGIYHNDAHSKKTVMATQKNTRYGHLHTLQAYSGASIVGEDAHTAISVPSLCNLNPGYMRNKPSAWLNGFSIAYIKPNGDFNDYVIIVNKNGFNYGGKEY